MRAAVAALVLVAGARAQAQDHVPEPLGLMVMLKIVSYDTAFPSHGNGEFVVLVPFAPGDEAKANELAAVGAALEVKSIKERPIHFMTVPLADLGSKKGAAVLLHSGFPSTKASLEKVKDAKVYVLTFDEASVRDGALLGVGLANGKPQPLINVAAMRAIGADFGPVLRLARTFQ